jgi:hypothetical protein
MKDNLADSHAVNFETNAISFKTERPLKERNSNILETLYDVECGSINQKSYFNLSSKSPVIPRWHQLVKIKAEIDEQLNIVPKLIPGILYGARHCKNSVASYNAYRR